MFANIYKFNVMSYLQACNPALHNQVASFVLRQFWESQLHLKHCFMIPIVGYFINAMVSGDNKVIMVS